jgi:putative ABC transport system substrate-binding protein
MPGIIGIMHSGTSGHHDAHLNALKIGLAWAGQPYSGLTPHGPFYANDNRQTLHTIAGNLAAVPNIQVIIAGGGTASAMEAMNATNTISIVYTSVAFSARPAQNMTGICARTSELDRDRLRYLHAVRGSSPVGVLTNSSRPNFSNEWATLQAAANSLNVRLQQQDVTAAANIHSAFNSFQPGQPVLVTADPLFNNNRPMVITAAGNRNTPAIYQWREFAQDGGLMSYGPSLTYAYELAGNYAGQILNGAQPNSLNPVTLQTLELVINLRTANDLNNALGGFQIPPGVLAQANDIIWAP